MKFDIHTHILPKIDDGAKDVEQSIALVEKLSSQGVTHIALTPHFYSNEESMDKFLEKRKKSFDKFIEKAPKNVTYTIGAEVYFSEYLFNNKSIKELCYKNTNYLLIEFPYNTTFTGKSENDLYKLISDYGVKPVLPHIERYPSILDNYKMLEKLIGMGCTAQINLDSLNSFMTKRKILKLFKRGLISYVGTDTHSFTKGSEFESGYSLLEQKIENFSNSMQKNSKVLFVE